MMGPKFLAQFPGDVEFVGREVRLAVCVRRLSDVEQRFTYLVCRPGRPAFIEEVQRHRLTQRVVHGCAGESATAVHS